MTSALLAALLVVALLVAVFAGENNSVVVVRFLGWHVGTTLPVVIFACVLLGALAAGILAGVGLVRARLRIRSLEAELAQAGRAGRLAGDRSAEDRGVGSSAGPEA